MLRTGLRQTALPLRLALIAALFTVPIVFGATERYARVSADVAHASFERRGVAFITATDRVLAAAAGAPIGRPLDSEERVFIELPLASVRAIASVPRPDPELQSAYKRIARAVERYESLPSAGALQDAADDIFRSVDRVSDVSKLSFEPNVTEGYLGDIIANVYPTILGRAASAAAGMEMVAPASRAPVAERIAVAALLAKLESPTDVLGLDMTGAINADADVGLAARLSPRWHAFERAVTRSNEPLHAFVRTGVVSPDSLLAGEMRAAIVRNGDAFAAGVQSELFAMLDARVRHDAFAHRVIVGVALLVALSCTLILTSIAGAIARRDRRELLRVQQRAQTLDAELARQRAESRLESAQAQFRAVFDRSQIGIALLDAEGATVECNNAFYEMFSATSERVVRGEDARFAALTRGECAMFFQECAIAARDGATRWVEIEISPIAAHDRSAVIAIAMVRDITDRKSVDERLRYAATHDALTSLANRGQFLLALGEDLAGEHLAPARGAVLFIDLDEFKAVNDTLGHHAGDAILVVTADRLRALAGDGNLVARFHGDEFAIYLRRVASETEALAVAECVQIALKAPVTVDGRSAVVKPSIGVVFGVNQYERAEEIVRDADAAMYHAKSSGGARYMVFDEGMIHDRSRRLRIASDLHLGLERGEFSVAYQPVVALQTRETIGFEALLRWDHPVLGRVPPAVFIPIAEESSAIFALGQFALESACRMLAQRIESDPAARHLTMNVNLSVAQLSEPGLVADVERTLRAAGLPAERVTFEITETALLEDGPLAAGVLHALKALGVRLCVDDFGMGYSSLRYLHQFPIDAIKIDRTFIHNSGARIASEPIVQMLLTLATALDLDVIAEGIETEAECAQLIAAGCLLGQGYLISVPIESPSQIDRFLYTAASA